jgi:hypothetical protein
MIIKALNVAVYAGKANGYAALGKIYQKRGNCGRI